MIDYNIDFSQQNIDFCLPSLIRQIDEEIAAREKDDILHFRTVAGIKGWYPNPKQLEFYATGLIAKERALFAANKMGKSFGACVEIAAHATLYYPDWWNGYVYDKALNIWIAGVTLTSTNLSLKKYLLGDSNRKGIIHPDLITGECKRDNITFIRNRTGGTTSLVFKSHEQDREKFQAENVDIVYLDEQYPYEIHSECVARTAKISASTHGQVLATFSPIKGTTLTTLHFTQSSDLESDTVRNISPGEVHNQTVYINATLDDALHIDDEEKKRLIASYSPHEREARVRGMPSLGSGLIYPVHLSDLFCDGFQIPDYWPRFFGLDIGFDPSPTAAVFFAYDQDNDIIYAYAEYGATRLTPQHHAHELIKQGANWIPYAYDTSGNAASPTDGVKVIDLYKVSGMRNAYPANKSSVNAGIFVVRQRMENGKFKILRNALPRLTNELLTYGRDEVGKIIKGNDHYVDAMRYAINSALKHAITRPTVRKPMQFLHKSDGDFGMRL